MDFDDLDTDGDIDDFETSGDFVCALGMMMHFVDNFSLKVVLR
uniref:Uncharacterized protein n=1 Tax=Medicago truncatula TaxID=3880 RepID=I3S8A8_MEDTR|nr:unknown [Medicago truncatula]